MADLGMDFDPADVPESDRNFDPIPAGAYAVQVVESEVADTKSGNGQQLVLTFEIVEGQYEKRKLWDRLNIRHTNEMAQSIAQRALADLFLATNTPPSRDSEDLHFKPLLAKVVIEKDKDGHYADKNVIKGYRPLNAASPAQKPPTKPAPSSARPQAQAPQQAAAGGKRRPW